MAKGDISLAVPQGSGTQPGSYTFKTEANGTAILAGEPVKIGGTGNNYVVPSADAEPLTSAPTFAGIASSNSTQTATADGTVDVQFPTLGSIWKCKAKSASAFDTDAEILAVLNDTVLFDLTSGVYTVDTGTTSATSGLKIVGGDASTSTVYFLIRSGATMLA